MTASDHLNPDQFTDWYHGTSGDSDSITTSGLTSSNYSRDNPTLTAERHVAEAHGNSVFRVRIPNNRSSEFIHDEMARDTGIKKPVPLDMIHKL